ncbi:MAG: hypothetical protein ABFD54_08140 [Armatimonadota bacterium]|nr:hypothetical protein [bacterium]
MTDRDVLSLAGRVLGIVWLIVFISGVYQAVSQVYNTFPVADLRSLAVAACISPALALLISLVMLVFSNQIARLLVPQPVTMDSDWQRWAFSTSAKVMGLVLLLHGLWDLCESVVGHYVALQMTSTINRSWHLTPNFLTAAVTLAISAYLLTGAKHLYLDSPLSTIPQGEQQ